MVEWLEIAVPVLTAFGGVLIGGWMSGRQAKEQLQLQLAEERRRLLIELQYENVMEFVRISTILVSWPALIGADNAKTGYSKLKETITEWRGKRVYTHSLGVEGPVRAFHDKVNDLGMALEEGLRKGEKEFMKACLDWMEGLREPYDVLVGAI